jgi:RNA polymerase-binding transcription factor DksA
MAPQSGASSLPPGTGSDRRVDRERLVGERRRLASQVGSLQREFDAIVESSELVSTDDEHDPDGSTVAFERQMVAGLLKEARHQHGEIDAALARVDAGTYGRCAECGERISPERLDALPATTVCVRCA